MRLTSTGMYTRPAPVPKMPAGLVELMDGMARDVLLNNPTDVYAFCANHMQKLLEIRDGPSRKKPLTLEQKILKAQEKVRQRAKERREKFDKETQLQSKICQEVRTFENADTPLTEESLVIPNLKTTVQYVQNLQHAPEVEISRDPPKILPLSQLGDVSEPSNVTELNTIVEEVNQVATKDTENSIETSTNEKQQDQAISENFDSTPDVKSKNEVISEEIIPVQKAEESTISENVSLLDKKLADEDIFGKVEIDERDVEPSKDPKTIDIMVIEKAAESELQTIVEASDESSVSEGSAVLPKITIGDEHYEDIKNKPCESVIEVELDVKNNLNEEHSVEKNSCQEIILHNSESNIINTTDNINENESMLHNENVTSTDVHGAKNETLDIIEKENNADSNLSEQMNNEKIDNFAEIVAVPETRNSPDSGYTEVKDLYEGDVEEAKNSDDNAIASANPINRNDNPNVIQVQYENVSNIAEKDFSSNELTVDHAIDEKQSISTKLENVTENKPGSENEGKINIEEGNINVVEPVPQQIVQETDDVTHEVEKNKQSVSNDYKELHNNGTDLLLPKSDSIENTNEDSLSIIESDFSKTDEDSQNNPNMDLETAAVTIQNVFRSFMFKSRNSTFEDTANDEHNSQDEEENDKKEEYYAAANLNKERRPLGITRMDTVLQTVNEEKSLSLSTDDSSTLSSAATTIQAHVRGFLVRNRFNSSKTFSTNSLVNSHEVLETDSDQLKNKTVLNIHIVPEEGNYLSRDESLITSMDLSLDGSPPSSVNLHPLSCDITERRKMLKREDAVQSVSPPSNNSGKLSEDSIKEVMINENDVLERESTDDKTSVIEDQSKDVDNEGTDIVSSASTVTPTTIITISKSEDPIKSPREILKADSLCNGKSFAKMGSDETDVITPFVPSPRSSEEATTLVHSGEFHDVVLPTKITRNDTPVVREFKNVLVYFILWNNS